MCAFDGSGTFSRTNGVNSGSSTWATDRDAGAAILAGRHDTHDQDIATGLSSCITKSGETTVTANIPFGGFRLTNVAVGTARTDTARVSQIQDGTPVYAGTTAGSVDAYTASLTPAITAYTTGMLLSFKADRANTTTTVTLNVNSVAATAVKKYDGATALEVNDILSGQTYVVEHNGTSWVLLNPSKPKVSGLSTTGDISSATLTASGNVTVSNLTASKPVFSSAGKVLSSTGPAISTYTPTISGNGAMTTTALSVYQFRYFQDGPFIHFNVGLSFTVGGTPNTTVNVTVPVAGTTHNVNCTFACAGNDGGGTGFNDLRWRYDGTNLIIFKAGLANWTAGVNAAIFIDGKYES